MLLKDKVVLITGAAGGIGTAAAKAFAKEGAKLALVDLNEDALKKVSEQVEASDILFVSADVTKEDQVKNYVDKTVEKYGRIDVFINNAGVNGANAPIVEQTEKNLRFVMDVNFFGAYYGLKYVLSVMREQKSGSVVNTASNGGWLGAPGMSVYVASKHALLGLTKSAALEMASYGVRVNAVAPGATNTEMMRRIERNAVGEEHAEEAQKAFAAAVPMGRYATPEEIADLMVFLGSDKSRFIDGTMVRIDGGMSSTSAQ
ncbi:SDR family NAD(P)-dependent oxidoreductase [Bacillus sp. FJAT-29814]|uniref:SDR family NAD(P)-dependent oxidoreductase n=1 Tax=Bacillus sp. FJAT-29814 TaxID=1729688 RepID=UPI00083499A4|nr:glucose 1-dehydrogenase [Bacillus sp. FJAT-29814]